MRGGYLSRYGLAYTSLGSSAGYFLASRLLVGLSLDYRQLTDNYSPGALARVPQTGPVERAYVGRGRIAPYLEAGYQVGWIFPTTSRSFNQVCLAQV